jgi:drug/metabolite transporter (DMT)-like permease
MSVPTVFAPILGPAGVAGMSLIGAETLLALTPIVIKQTPLDPISTLWTRILPSFLLGYGLSKDRELNMDDSVAAAALGNINLLHISSSYEAFRNLPAGQAMSLFYTFPIWIVLFGSIFLGETIRASEYGCMAIAALGSVLLNMDPGRTAPSLGRPPHYGWGTLMGLTAALTEASMTVMLHGLGWMDAAKSVWVVNGSASLWLASVLGITALTGTVAGPHVTGDITDAAWLTVFHSLSTFAGYWLRFFAIPRLSSVSFAFLSYTGLLASYVLGWWFLREQPGWMSLLGAACILVSGVLLQIYAPS